MSFVGNLLLFAAWKNFANRSRIDKVIAMVRVAPFFDSRCSSVLLLVTYAHVALSLLKSRNSCTVTGPQLRRKELIEFCTERKHVNTWSRSPHGKEQFAGKGRPIVKYRDALPWALQKRLNRSRCRLGLGLEWAQNCIGWRCTLRYLLNTIAPSMCCGDAAFCQITLTTC